MSYQDINLQDTAVMIQDSLTMSLSPAVSESNNIVEIIGANSNSGSQTVIIAIVSVGIALLALLVSYRVFKITKAHNKLSLKPLLIFRVDTSHSVGKARFYMLNKGLGPCIIEDFSFSFEDQHSTDIADIFNYIKRKFNYKNDDFDPKYNLKVYPLSGYALTPDEDKTLLKYRLKSSRKLNREFYFAVSQITIHYHYKDYYNESVKDSFMYFKDLHGKSMD